MQPSYSASKRFVLSNKNRIIAPLGHYPQRGVKFNLNPIETVLAFLDAINRHDAERLAELMTEDHRFVDSLGKCMQGRETMRNGWLGYFTLCPDYWVSREELFHTGRTVAAFGSAGGTISMGGQLLPENKWEVPAAWRAVVEDGLIQEWRVYADNQPVYDILAKSERPEST
jgi:ketosteroid isomerase-like protein